MSEALYERYKDALRRGHAAALAGSVRRGDRRLRGGRLDRPGPRHAAGQPGRRPRPDRADQPRPSPPTTSRSRARPRTRPRCAAGRRCSRSPAAAPRQPRRSIGSPPCSIATGRLLEATERPVAPWSWPNRAADARAWRPSSTRLQRGRRRPGVRGAQPGARHARRPRDGGRRRRLPAGAGTASSSFVEQKRDPRRSVMSAAAVLTAAAETALDGGDQDEARRCYLEAAAAQRSIGNLHAAMDACYQALAVSPAAGDVHLSAHRAVPRPRLARAGGRQARPARSAGRARRRRPDPGPAVHDGRRSVPRGRPAGGHLRLMSDGSRPRP